MRLGITVKSDLKSVHSALNDALGDTDITHLTDDEVRNQYPVQWAAEYLAKVIDGIEHREIEWPSGVAPPEWTEDDIPRLTRRIRKLETALISARIDLVSCAELFEKLNNHEGVQLAYRGADRAEDGLYDHEAKRTIGWMGGEYDR